MDFCHNIWSDDIVTDDHYEGYGTARALVMRTMYDFGPARTNPDRIELPVVEIRNLTAYRELGGIEIRDIAGHVEAVQFDLAGGAVLRWWPNAVLMFPFISEMYMGNLLGQISDAAQFLATPDDRIVDCGTGIWNDFYGAFQVGSRACAVHSPSADTFDPYVRVRLDSAAPWRFTKCTIHWAYRTSQYGTVVRPPDVDCTSMINDMLRTGRTSITRDFLSLEIKSSYLDLWGHVTVRFDHTDWNASDFHYFQTQ